MLNAYADNGLHLVRLELAGAKPEDIQKQAIWFDLQDPTPDEEQFVEHCLGLSVPTRDEMKDIEPSARLYVEAGTEFMTMTALANLTAHDPVKAPVTFVLSGNALVTIRYSDPTPFSLFINTATRPSSRKYISPDRVMVGLIEALIDRLAQVLELAGDDLDQISRDIFRSKEKRPNHISRNLEKLIERIGNKGDFLTMVQESLVSIVRLTTFHQSLEEVPSARDVKQELKLLQHDASALIEHAGFLSNKVTFLLDATLGLINLEQNAIIKIFSVAAVIFLPPTLVASLYGMNFRSMPELEWVFGYPYAIGLMIISAIVPYLFFKRKGWL